jgi:maleate isomerase
MLSCTNLRTLDAIPRIEAALGLPAVSSNSALAEAALAALRASGSR